MTLRAIGGLALLNGGFAAVGVALLWGIRGWRSWTELLRLVGLGYFLGLAAMMVVLTAALVSGIPFGPVPVLVAGATLASAGVLLGRARGRAWPSAPSRLRLPTLSLFAAFMVACLVLWVEASFRAARLQPLWLFDAWWVWTIRAKALHFFGELGGLDLVRADVTAYETYPPGLSLVQAQAFEAMGSVDTVTLSLQNWFLAVGFLAATFGLLAGRVRTGILAPVLLLTIVMPNFADIAIWPVAEPLLGYLVAVAAILLCLWLEDEARWRVVVAAVLLGGAVLVKREAALVVLCVVIAALLASLPNRRTAWPRIGVLAAAIVAMALPWRLWLVLSDVSEAPTRGYFAFVDDPARGLDSAQLAASTFFGTRWGLPMWLCIAALVLALASGKWTTPSFTGVFLVGFFLVSTFIIWNEPFFEISQVLALNPIVRMTMVAVIVATPLTAVMLEDAMRGGSSQPIQAAPGTRNSFRHVASWCLIAGALLVYPMSAVFNVSGPTLPGGKPVFPEPPRALEGAPRHGVAAPLDKGLGRNETNGGPDVTAPGRSLIVRRFDPAL